MGIRNYFYLTAGILAVLFAATHAWNGHAAVLPELAGGAVALAAETVFTYVWHIITAENLIFGIAFLMMAFIREPAKHRFAARMIAVILAVRLAVILGITAAMDASSLAASTVDAAAIVVYIALILFGARVKPRQPRRKARIPKQAAASVGRAVISRRDQSRIPASSGKAHVARAAIESIAYQVCDASELLRVEPGLPLVELFRLWNEKQAAIGFTKAQSCGSGLRFFAKCLITGMTTN